MEMSKTPNLHGGFIRTRVWAENIRGKVVVALLPQTRWDGEGEPHLSSSTLVISEIHKHCRKPANTIGCLLIIIDLLIIDYLV
jgi:hypothetical protein